ncbi:hypothetical protein GQ54DRAFT_314551 [Martensiomyces pterosporus]|nr:hypothetical protein GQ54DRAFT_314551 [Martensiomyces pterosporus]
MPFISNPLSGLLAPATAESMTGIASNVRRCVDNLDARYIGRYIDTINSAPSLFAQPTVYLATHSTLLLTTNQTRFSMFEADFGDGHQEWVTFIKDRPGTIIFMPCPPPTKGVNISMCVEASVLRELLANEFWMNITSQIC